MEFFFIRSRSIISVQAIVCERSWLSKFLAFYSIWCLLVASCSGGFIQFFLDCKKWDILRRIRSE
jgi:hypothetical protein